MKITIDTKEDSPEDIKKAIQLLQHLIGEKSSNEFSVDESSNAFQSIFGEQTQDEASQTTEQVSELTNKKEKIPLIVPY